MKPVFLTYVLLFLFLLGTTISTPVISEEGESVVLEEEVIITVDSTNLQFSPSEVTITEGDTVRFFWQGQLLAHNAVEKNGIFDSGDPERDVDYSFKFEVGTNGTYDFVCEPHESANMVGKIIVNPLIVTEEEVEEEEKSVPGFSAILLLTSLITGAIVSRRAENGNF
jgi:plastocyanin|tara:strand:- start:690 stop:1193 length:504 start_codon:yes stop_codon:yes gene_type:complete